MQAEARIKSSKATIHYDVLGCLERALLLIAHADCIIHAGSAALGHENGDLSRQLCQLERTCIDCEYSSLRGRSSYENGGRIHATAVMMPPAVAPAAAKQATV